MEDIVAILEFGAPLGVFVGIADRITHPIPNQPKLSVYHSFLTDFHKIEEQRFETICPPILDTVTFFNGDVADRLVGPDFSNLRWMESFMGYDQLHASAQNRITGMLVEVCSCEPFQQHLHTDQLIENNWGLDQVVEQIAQHITDRIGRTPTGRYIIRKSRSVPRFFARLIGRIFLGASIEQNIGKACRQIKRALFAVNDVENLPENDLVAELDLLPFIEPVEHGPAQLLDALRRHEIFSIHVERLAEIDLTLVVRIPKMIVHRRNDLIEIARTVVVTIDEHYRANVFLIYR